MSQDQQKIIELQNALDAERQQYDALQKSFDVVFNERDKFKGKSANLQQYYMQQHQAFADVLADLANRAAALSADIARVQATLASVRKDFIENMVNEKGQEDNKPKEK